MLYNGKMYTLYIDLLYYSYVYLKINVLSELITKLSRENLKLNRTRTFEQSIDIGAIILANNSIQSRNIGLPSD